MAKLLYFDCFSGASGDMVLGALLDAGLPVEALREALGSLAIAGYQIAAHRVVRSGVSATKFALIEQEEDAPDDRRASASAAARPEAEAGAEAEAEMHAALRGAPERGRPSGVDPSRDEPPPDRHDGRRRAHLHAHGDHRHPHAPGHGHDHSPGHGHGTGLGAGHRTLREIEALIATSALSSAAQDRAIALFRRLAEAEAAIHDMPLERVHLHEVGALDSIIDIVGGVFAIEWFGADRIVASPLNLGGGMVDCAHGRFPVPAPATARLVTGVPVYSAGPKLELLTPTGALLVTGYAEAYGPLPPMAIERIGYGAGDKDIVSTPNVLRVLVGTAADEAAAERLVVLACEIDDMNPQLYGVLLERLLAAGALDVFYAPVQMKKNRPGTLVTVLAAPERRVALSEIIFAETTTLGVRYHDVLRDRLEREESVVPTAWGDVRIKVARRAGRVMNAAPEFDDCVRLATAARVPVKDVQAAATQAFLNRQER